MGGGTGRTIRRASCNKSRGDHKPKKKITRNKSKGGGQKKLTYSICHLVFFSFRFFSCVVFRLFLSCRPSVGPSTGHSIGLIAPANNNLNLAPSGHGLRPERMFVLVSFFLFCLLPFCPSFSGVLHLCTMDMFLVLWFKVMRDGVCHSSLVPFPCLLVLRCTCYFALVCFLPSRRFFCSLFCDWARFRKIS